MPDLLLIASIAGLLAIDDRAGWQSLLGEPVFSSLIIGALLGTLRPALEVGVVLQLAWLSIGAARGTRRPNTVVGGVVGAGAACLALSQPTDPRASIVVAAGVLMGLVAAELGAIAARAANGVRERWLGNFRLPEIPPQPFAAASRKLALTVVGSALFVGAVDFAAVLLLLPVATRVVLWLAGHLGADAATGAVWWLACVAAIGLAAVVRAFGTRVLVRFLVVGVVAVLVVGWFR
jgi:mannose/fructose/N-acetylgalactosamine-specific phosphotransferase system component IIC